VVMTPLWYALGAFTTLSMFPLSQAIVGILTLAVGDPVASLVGLTSENTHKIPFNNDKSYEGSLAGILASWIVCLIFIESRMAVVGCTAGMLAEALPLKVNDNVLIPVIAAAAAYGYSLYL
jgi:dolichol kinase